MAAALKRAQAHHRRSSAAGAGGAHHDLLHPPSCLVPVRVDLDQLVLSILDDPSVSRVMREAGFSSTIVKTNIESNSEDRIKNPTFLFPRPKTEVEAIFNILLGKTRKNVVVVGDSPASAERVVSEFIDRFEKGDVPAVEPLKSVKLVKLQFSTIPLKFMKRHEVDMNVGDLKRKVESFGFGGRVVIYIGDLKWAIERDYDHVMREFDFSAIYRNPIDYLVSEIGKLVSWYNSSSSIRVWLMATADNETYAKCRMKKPSLEGQWDLEPVFVLSGGLGSSIDGMSYWDSRITSKSCLCPHKEHENNVPTSCLEYTSNFEQENGRSAQLPYWLKPHGNKVDLTQLRRTKYDALISKNHFQSSPYPCWPNKVHDDVPNLTGTISFSYPSLNPNQNPTSVPRFRQKQHSSHVDFGFSNGSAENNPSKGPNLDSLKRTEGKDVKITLSLGNSSDHKKIWDLRDSVQENVPWQCETIPMIVDSLMEYCCREIEQNGEVLLIEGNDFVGKRRLAVGIAKAVFGSTDMLFCMNMRHNENYTVAENRAILEMALRNNDKLIVFIENVDYADQEFVEFLVHKKVSCRAIFVLTTDGDVSSNYSVIPMKLLASPESKHGLISKRKYDSDFPIKGKNQRKKHNEVEEVSSNGVETVLDLNVKANDHDEEQGNLSSISSELTREITAVERDDDPNSLARLKNIIKNRFAFNRDSDKDEKAREMLLSKIEGSFRNATNYYIGFDVEEDLLEEVRRGSGLYLNDLFGEWLKDIFQASLSMVGVDRENSRVRLCLDGKLGECCEEDGYMGTCLPKIVPVCFQ
ncbi:double Clp-N motif-containing P-loop nucleosidetriphosphate hydrolases superfamily protein [Striga asiatica]|uniref:Double Clp-N motif-containing P-loop nucleosidetriphosphate hydrolases superfamily protein n=1 Tax=Striga asiatica TaxID=4170 RepID=A0A5A7QUQ2_STRAF|nr:double Clp-N motif-containing P-loop nucleosidetriphosphate hydrolases superfamily protein [Striga asiatica]